MNYNLREPFKKDCIFKRLKYCTWYIEEKLTNFELTGIDLEDFIESETKDHFQEYDESKIQILTLRVSNNINRGIFCEKFYFNGK